MRAGTKWHKADDPTEALRRLRVATRRLRSFVRLFAPMIGDKRARKLYRRLRAVTRAVGPLRQHDGLLAELRERHEHAPPLTRAALEHVIASIEADRTETIAPARTAIREAKLKALARELEEQLDRICGRLFRLDMAWPAQAWTLVQPQLARTFDGLPDWRDASNVEGLHEIRTRAKAIRYALELLGPVLGEAYPTVRGPAKQIQRSLGTHRDRTLLAELLQRHRDTLRTQGLSTLAGALDPMIADFGTECADTYAQAKPALQMLDRERYAAIIRYTLGIAPAASPSKT